MADDNGVWRNLSGMLRSLLDGFKDGMREEPPSQFERSGSSGSPRGAMYISGSDFLLKAAVLVMTHYVGMVSGAYALYKEEDQLLFSLAYAVPWVVVTVLGGLVGGAVLWLIVAALFEVRTRAAARVLVLTSACVVALYLYLYQFAVSDNWTAAFGRQSPTVIMALVIAFIGALPWTRRGPAG